MRSVITTVAPRSNAVAAESFVQRRSFLARCAALTGCLLVRPVFSRQVAPGGGDRSGHAQFIAQALHMKKRAVSAGDQPYGAIVVKGDRIVGFGPSRVITRQDPTAHAEMEAIRDAAQRLGTRDLSGCILYSTSRPCRMCETAAYWANVSSMFFGATPVLGVKPDYDC